MKIGDIVTVDTPDNISFSNTFIVQGFLKSEKVLLSHPIAPEVYTVRPKEDLDKAAPIPKNSQERQLSMLHKFSKLLGQDDLSLVDCLTYYAVIRRNLSKKQLSILSQLCGKVAQVYCNHDLSIAMRMIKENKVILDEYNLGWYYKFKEHFEDGVVVTLKNRRNAIFNICGYVMAQLEV